MVGAVSTASTTSSERVAGLALLCSFSHRSSLLSLPLRIVPRSSRPQPIEQFARGGALVDQPSHVVGGSAQWLHHRHPAAAVRGRRRTPSSPSWRPRPTRGTWRGNGPGSRRGSVVGGLVTAHNACSGVTRVARPARRASQRSGRRSWYCRSMAFSRASPRAEPVARRHSRRAGGAWPPSRPGRRPSSGSTRAPSARAPSGPARRGRRPRRRSPDRGAVRTLTAASYRPHWMSRALARRPSESITVACSAGVVAHLADRRHRMGERASRHRARRPRSSRARSGWCRP